MTLTFLERRALNAISDKKYEYGDVAPSARGGVLGSLTKKGFTKYEGETVVITNSGKKALREMPPPGQEAAYKEKEGARKAVGLERIKKRR